jgi:abequosyltransferase
MESSRPILTIAIPTYNRRRYLEELLVCLDPQLKDRSKVELLISDNASQDDTRELVESFQGRGLELRYVRNAANIGPDANFAQCFDLARGRYFLLFGDDDLVVPGAVDKILGLLEAHDPDIVYLCSYSFSSDFMKERKGDLLGRGYRILTDPLQFARTVNIMLTFISGVIVNRERLLEQPHEPISDFLGTNLIQMSWTLPLLRAHRRSVCVWERLVAGRTNNSGGYNIARVFGVTLKQVSERLLSKQPEISQALSNSALRRWFPAAILDLRSKGAIAVELEEVHTLLSGAHKGNWRLAVFVLPAMYLPMSMAKVWVAFTRLVNKLIYVVHLPDFWRQG